MDDPQVQGRQVGWVTKTAPEYIHPVRRVAVRCRKQDGQWAIGVLISTLTDAQVLSLTGQEAKPCHDPEAFLLACVWLYDQRGGGVETSFKGDKQGLGISKRNKKRGSRAADGDVVGQPGSQCGRVVPLLADSLAFAIAALWHAAHDSRCLPCQWLSCD